MYRQSMMLLRDSSSQKWNIKQLTHLRSIFGTYAKKPCRFVGSPAVPAGPNHEVRYESLDVQYLTSSSAKTETAFASATNKPRLHRIHHIAGFISSLYVAEYRQYHQSQQQQQQKGNDTDDEENSNNKNYERFLFLLDTGIPTDVTRIETALRHVLRCEQLPKDSPDFVSKQMKLVFSTHSHADHNGGIDVWRNPPRSVPTFTVPGADLHYEGFGGKIQFLVEVFGSNLYAWYLLRTAREYTWFNPHLHDKLPVPTVGGGGMIPVEPFDDWITIQVPGHTTHMCMLYHPVTRSLYCADLFLHQFNKYRPPIPVDRMDCYLRSLEMVKDLPVRWLLMPHGGIMQLEVDPELEDEAINVEKRLQQQEQEQSESDEQQQPQQQQQKNQMKHQQEGDMGKQDVAKMKTHAKSGDFKSLLVSSKKKKNANPGQAHFRDICASVAERAKATEANAKKASPFSVVSISRWFAKSSPAPAKFDWDRGDMVSPDEQMSKVRAAVDKANALRRGGGRGDADGDGVAAPVLPVLKHFDTYEPTSTPGD